MKAVWVLFLLEASIGDEIKHQIYPRPPLTTPALQAFLTRVNNQAHTCSTQATPAVLKFLDSPTFRQNISSLSVKGFTAQNLLNWFVDNVRATNIISNWNFSRQQWFETNKFLPTKWELQALGEKTAGTMVEEVAETQLMGLPPFAKKITPTLTESYDRPGYLAANIWRKAWGNNRYGEMTFAIRPSLKPYMPLSPVDTGRYVLECMNYSTTPTTSNTLKSQLWNCTSWKDHCWGTFTDFNHLILQHTIFFDYALSFLFARLDLKAKAIKSDWYYEIPFTRSIYLPESVHYTVGDYHTAWGSKPLREWHVANVRPLLWMTFGDDSWLVDLDVLLTASVPTVHGYTATAAELVQWNSYWATFPASLEVVRNGTNRALQLHIAIGSQYTGVCHQQSGGAATAEIIGINLLGHCVWTNFPLLKQ